MPMNMKRQVYNDTLPAIMLAIDMDYREIAVATTQSYVDYFPVSKTDDMVDDVTDYLRDGRYADGVRAFLDDSYQTIVNYGVKPVGTIVMVSLGAGVLIAALVVGCMIVAHPKVSNSQISATAYLKDGRVQLHTKRDRFVRTFTPPEPFKRITAAAVAEVFPVHLEAATAEVQDVFKTKQ